MDGVQLQRALQDENAGHLPASALGNNKPGLQGGPGLKAAPLSARKAFGNITNKAGPAPQQDAPEAGTVKRRALGELSVNRPPQQQCGGDGDGGKGSRMKAGPSRQPLAPQQQAAPAEALPAADLATQYAAGGVERFAGKTWRALEEEREEEEEAAAAAAARRLTARLTSWQLRARPLQVGCRPPRLHQLDKTAPRAAIRFAVAACHTGLAVWVGGMLIHAQRSPPQLSAGRQRRRRGAAAGTSALHQGGCHLRGTAFQQWILL
jgi:hypothetical protein